MTTPVTVTLPVLVTGDLNADVLPPVLPDGAQAVLSMVSDGADAAAVSFEQSQELGGLAL